MTWSISDKLRAEVIVVGVGSFMSDLVVWGFRVFVFTGLSTTITLLVLSARINYRVRRHLIAQRQEPIEWVGCVDHPDEVAHPYSLTRAWDRHLISIGLESIGGGTAQMLASWEVSGPDAEVWWIDDNGRSHTLPYKTLLQGELWKASDSPRGRDQDAL